MVSGWMAADILKRKCKACSLSNSMLEETWMLRLLLLLLLSRKITESSMITSSVAELNEISGSFRDVVNRYGNDLNAQLHYYEFQLQRGRWYSFTFSPSSTDMLWRSVYWQVSNNTSSEAADIKIYFRNYRFYILYAIFLFVYLV